MKILKLCFALELSVLLCCSASADTFLVEQFEGYSDGRLGDPNTGGDYTIPGWYTPRDGITVSNALGSLDGRALGLPPSMGAKVQINNSGVSNLTSVYNKFVNAGAFPPDTETNLYYSFLYRFRNLEDIPSGTACRIVGVSRQNSGVTTESGFYWWLTARNTGSAIQIGINKYLGATNFAATTINAGDTIFIVVRQRILAGASNDVEELWINPPPDTFGLDETSVPPPAAATADGVEDPSSTGPGRFHLVQFVNAEVDEIRIGSTWAAAAPGDIIPPAHFDLNPSNVTQVAEISAQFRVNSGNTLNPVYQWQINPNGTGAWTDISGAIQTTYDTPNLYLPSDQGNQYRVILTSLVGTKFSAATSSVATVTLTNPVITADGLIVQDLFTDGSRQAGPITVSNSLWFTALAAATNLDACCGNLTGVPQSGVSSLWLGFFTETDAPPVHLVLSVPDQRIKVTLPFILSGFTAQTNNGPLRFGLFDYYDAGGRPTADAPALTGSGGQGFNVRGYVLSVNFGPTFAADLPLTLLARTVLADDNLMGNQADYSILGSGPDGGGYSNAPAFVAGTPYLLEFSVERAAGAVYLTATISGGATNWTCTAVDTNCLYHRFDAFAIRPNSLETMADSFVFPDFTIEVSTSPPAPIFLFGISNCWYLSSTQFALTWGSVSGLTYQVQSCLLPSSGSWVTNAAVLANSSLTTHTNIQPAAGQTFYRVVLPIAQ